ncbi:lytic transglycosylase [Vibrio ostreicida]|uniref:lytic transglycosylase n=1 Tax=Vibrio ostreicida TaxID=526588 RepID=UPI003B5B331F
MLIVNIFTRYVLGFSFFVFSSGAFSSVSLIKDTYKEVAVAKGVPVQALYAIGLTETGITTDENHHVPWQYSLNIYKKEYRFNSQEKACEAVLAAIKKTEAVDIGETQLHWRYFKSDSPCDYFEREKALSKTADILKKCYEKHKNWVSAAGCYHRPKGGRLAEIYMEKYAVTLKQVLAEDW